MKTNRDIVGLSFYSTDLFSCHHKMRAPFSLHKYIAESKMLPLHAQTYRKEFLVIKYSERITLSPKRYYPTLKTVGETLTQLKPNYKFIIDSK